MMILPRIIVRYPDLPLEESDMNPLSDSGMTIIMFPTVYLPLGEIMNPHRDSGRNIIIIPPVDLGRGDIKNPPLGAMREIAMNRICDDETVIANPLLVDHEAAIMHHLHAIRYEMMKGTAGHLLGYRLTNGGRLVPRHMYVITGHHLGDRQMIMNGVPRHLSVIQEVMITPADHLDTVAVSTSGRLGSYHRLQW